MNINTSGTSGLGRARLSKRAAIRLISFTAALIAVLAVRNIQLMSQASSSERSLEYTYSRAMGDLCDAVEDISDTLEKELYAGSEKMHRSLSVQLYREAASAKAALSQLPIERAELENTYKFLSQVGDYSLSVSERLLKGEEISEEEYENIAALYDFAKSLSEDMWALESSVACGEISLGTDDTAAENEPPTVTDGFSDFENSFESYPTLIYDGPFSDNILERTPRMTASAEEVTQQKALERCSLGMNINSTEFTNISDVEGKMPCWRFSNDDSTIACEVTKNGGYISYFLKSRIVQETSLSNEQGVKAAEELLDDLGILSMTATYYENINNVLTVNFAYNDVNVCCYTDLIKVSVAMDDGEILGFDAKGFLVNHTDRDLPGDLISESRAEEAVSPKLSIRSQRLALIPSEGLEERLCYEFACTAENGRNVLVYVNAQTAEEEQILILVESDSGTLTI